MHKYIFSFLSITTSVCLIFISGCSKATEPHSGTKYPPDNKELVTISQGIWGNVWMWEGDFMPSPDGNSGIITPVERYIYIFKPTFYSSVVPPTGTRFTKINSILVDSVKSGSNGFYQISLPLGQYSLFVKEDSTYYANWFDGFGNIYPVPVSKDSASKFQIDLTYGAVY